ncbi:MAG: glucosaminidase domain-containing protein [Pseudomonadales bacterium]|nr:glucosaminidase domain-containing protein [Pseudomonadales bacterium]
MSDAEDRSDKDRSGVLVPGLALFLWVLIAGVWERCDHDAVLPPVELPAGLQDASLPDFGAIDDVGRKKQAFFEFLLPMVDAHNTWIRDNREFLQGVRDRMVAGVPLTDAEVARLAALADRYEVAFADADDLDAVDLLLFRADVIPPSLVLAQAAAESGWGTSRFARAGNNLFGEWCFSPGCGIVPGRRREGATHEVADFESVAASLESYFLNLNTHEAYRPVRTLRAQARRDGRTVRGVELAAGLLRYSERREAYVEEIRQIIRTNDLGQLDGAPMTVARLEARDGSGPSGAN